LDPTFGLVEGGAPVLGMEPLENYKCHVFARALQGSVRQFDVP